MQYQHLPSERGSITVAATTMVRSFRYRLLAFSLLLHGLLYSSLAFSLYPNENVFEPPPVQVPDLAWKPNSFTPISDFDARYIDYENGNDKNKGTSRAHPWRHHPWDENAKGRSASSKGVKTYFFKQGVTYRGKLIAAESGSADRPIVLSVDPEWGEGRAVLAGSQALSGDWKLCTVKQAAVLPAASKTNTWCRKYQSKYQPRRIWLTSGDTVLKIPLARTPNWKLSNPIDPRFEWPELEGATAIVRLDLDRANQFDEGDSIWPEQSYTDKLLGGAVAGGKVIAVSGRTITVQLDEKGGKAFSVNTSISNGRRSAVVGGISNTHDTHWQLKGIDPALVGGSRAEGAVVWVEQSGMPKPVAAIIDEIHLQDNTLSANLHLPASGGPRAYNRYYLEDAADFLDQGGEFFYSKLSSTSGLIYLRLPGDRDPNQASLEVAEQPVILQIHNQNHIQIAGLDFRFSNQLKPGTREARNAALYASAIQLRGSVDDVEVIGCRFEHVAAGLIAYPLDDSRAQVLGNLVVTDSIWADIDGEAISIGNGRDRGWYRDAGSRLSRVTVRRNKLDRVGMHPLGHWGLGSHGHGIQVNGAEIVEVSGNHVNYVGGAGILVYSGSAQQEGGNSYPVLRTLVHHNKVTNSILRLQDYGGISLWMGGPAYVYNNISGNPVGYKHAERLSDRRSPPFRRGSYGIGLYLDGQYKGYVFNNIVWGYSNKLKDRYYNSAAFNEAMGFMNTVFNNTFYNFVVGLHKGMFQHNRCTYVGNVLIDMGEKFIMQEPANEAIEYSTLAYENNVFSGSTQFFGQLGRGKGHLFPTVDRWRDKLRSKKAIEFQTGVVTPRKVVANKEEFDFRPTSDSAVIDMGSKVFVPWPLYRVVGEWNFIQSRSNPSVVMGENFNMNNEWIMRSMFDDIPRNSLNCQAVSAADYQNGELEDWARGALSFAGKNSYCSLSSSSMAAGYSWRARDSNKTGRVKGADRDTVNLDNENFLIEAVLKVGPGSQPIVNKMAENGYELGINEAGKLLLTLKAGAQTWSRESAESIVGEQWRHIIVEVDRNQAQGIAIYLDGKLSNGPWLGVPTIDGSLSNTADFLLGRFGDRYFSGAIDYLRIAKGTLAQAETSIDELYQWQFDGPFHYDFTGLPASGKSRDAGAVEYRPLQ